MSKGKIKVSVVYPNSDSKNFDMDYYCNTHLPMVSELLGDSLLGYTVEKGIGSAAPGSEAPFAAIGSIYFHTVDDFANSFGPNADQIMGDLPNFTNIEPMVQISEVQD